MSTITMSATNTRPTRTSRRKRLPNPNWREDFYRNGRPDEQEVIVISDSPTPPPAHIRQPPSQIETRGMKRGRRSPPQLSNPQQLQSSQVSLQPISAVLTHKRRRKGETQITQIHQQYNDTSYRSYISTSSHTSAHYREPISARESYSSASSSRQAIIPNYDDKDGHYIVKIGDDLTSR